MIPMIAARTTAAEAPTRMVKKIIRIAAAMVWFLRERK